MKKDALPILDDWIQTKSAGTKAKITLWLVGRGWLDPRKANTNDFLRLNWYAETGYALLGKDAESSVSLLIKLTENNDENESCAVRSLCAIRPPKDVFLPVLKRCLGDLDEVKVARLGQIEEMRAEQLAAAVMELYPDEAKALKICERFPSLCNSPFVGSH